MKILILGGGISGLSAAWFLKKKQPHAEITLLEKTKRLGGWIETVRQEGFLSEKGPRTFLVQKCPQLLSLIQEVGLEKELLFSDPNAKQRYVWTEGKLRSLSSFWLRLIGPLLKEPWIPLGTQEDESIHAFASRRLNPWIADTLFDPLTLGIYAGDSKKLSIRSCFPQLYAWEKKYGSLLKGAWKQKKGTGKGLFTLRGGMQTLIDVLQQKLEMQIEFDCPVEALHAHGVEAGGRFWEADQIFCALPRPAVSQLTSRSFPEQSIWVVSLGYSQTLLKRQKGYGYLIPSKEQEAVLGMIWDSDVFPKQHPLGTCLTVMLRPSTQEPLQEALRAVEKHLQIQETPRFHRATLAQEAIPQFEVGYGKEIAQFEQTMKGAFPRMILLGNYWESPSVEACIARSHSKIIN